MEQMEVGMKGESAFGGWQHCRGRILHMLVLNVAVSLSKLIILSDFSNKIYVVAFVRFVDGGEIQENVFNCKEPLQTSKAQLYLMSCHHV
jgi:hypothetical protein